MDQDIRITFSHPRAISTVWRMDLDLGRFVVVAPSSPQKRFLGLTHSSPRPHTGSTVTGYLAAQLARLAGLRVIAVADTSRHEARLKAVGVEHVVDRADTEAAIAEIRRITEGTARYAIDCIGSKTAAAAIDALSLDSEVFIVGLSGLPKEARARVRLCELVR